MAREQQQYYGELQIEDFHVTEEPFYIPQANEIELFEAAYIQKIPVLLKGPTGCGKTRFVNIWPIVSASQREKAGKARKMGKSIKSL